MSNVSKFEKEINQIAVNIKLKLGNAYTIREQINNISKFQEQLQVIKSQIDSELQKRWKWKFEEFKHNLSGGIKQGIEGLKNEGIQKVNTVIGYAGKGLDAGGQIVGVFDGGFASALTVGLGKMMADNFLENGVGKRPESFNYTKMSEKEKLVCCSYSIDNLVEKAEIIKQIGKEILANNELIAFLDEKPTIEVLYNFDSGIKKELIGEISDKTSIDFIDIENQIKMLEECVKIPFSFEDAIKMRREAKKIIQNKNFIKEINFRIDRTIQIIESTNNLINVDLISSLVFLLGDCLTELEFNYLGEIVLKYYCIERLPSEILQSCADIKQKINPLLLLAEEREKLAMKCFKEPSHMKQMVKEARWKNRKRTIKLLLIVILLVRSLYLIFNEQSQIIQGLIGLFGTAILFQPTCNLIEKQLNFDFSNTHKTIIVILTIIIGLIH